MKRLDISTYEMVAPKERLGDGNNVIGGYYIPEYETIGFFKGGKSWTSMDDGNKETMVSKFLQISKIPCAKTILAIKDGKKGLISLNMLGENETLLDSAGYGCPSKLRYFVNENEIKDYFTIDAFIKRDIVFALKPDI